MEDLDHDEARCGEILVAEGETVIFIVGPLDSLMTISNPAHTGPDWVTLTQYLGTKPSPSAVMLLLLLRTSSQ